MGFAGLTSGERKRLQQGILKPEEAALVSARTIAAGGGGGFWTSTWGQVVRGVGIAALNFVPVVGSVASAGTAAYDRQRFADLQRKANMEYSAQLTSRAQASARARASAPIMETSSYPWLPDWGNIGMTGGYTGGTFGNIGGGNISRADAATESGIRAMMQGISPGQWLIIAALGAMLVLSFLIPGRR